MIYADTNFFTNTLIDMTHRNAAEQLIVECPHTLPVTWLHRLEVVDTPAYTKDESGLYTQVLKNGQIERFAFHMEVKSVITHPSGQQVLPQVRRQALQEPLPSCRKRSAPPWKQPTGRSS